MWYNYYIDNVSGRLEMCSMELRKEEIYTTEFIEALPDGERAELINGNIYFMAPPRVRHQRMVSILHAKIFNYIESRKGSCEVFPAPFAVYLNNDAYTYVEPDISVICDKNKLDDKGCNGAPDWVIEIVSPNSKKMDYVIKLFKYKTSGVREYWIVDPEKDRITVYYFDDNFMEEYSFKDKVKVNIYDDFEIDFSQVNID